MKVGNWEIVFNLSMDILFSSTMPIFTVAQFQSIIEVCGHMNHNALSATVKRCTTSTM
jgi:hypothetical protein